MPGQHGRADYKGVGMGEENLSMVKAEEQPCPLFITATGELARAIQESIPME